MLQTRDLIWTFLLFGHAGKDANKIDLLLCIFLGGGENAVKGFNF